MEVQRVIEALQALDPEQQIMIQWFEKEHAEQNHDVKLTDEHWSMAVALFDKWDAPGSDDFGIKECIDEAAERLGAE
jgi:hypothetical protein